MTRPASAKPAFANWLVAQRKSRPGSGQKGEMTTAEMREAIRIARGFSMGHSTYAQLESGSRKPTPEQYAHITGYLGAEPPPEEQQEAATSSTDMAALVEQLRRQNELLAEQNAINRNLVAFLVTSYTSDKPPTWFEVKGGGWVDSLHLAIQRELEPAMQRALASLPTGTRGHEAGDKTAQAAKGRAR